MSSLDDVIGDKELFKKAVGVALASAEQAFTFGSKVGYVVQTYDNKLFGGSNKELYTYDSIHAEEDAILAAMREGYRFTDFKRLIGVFKESRGSSKTSSVPMSCFKCLGFIYDTTHPYIEIVKVNAEGEEVYRTRFNRLLNVDEIEIYPTLETRSLKKRINNRPKLPLNKELKEFYDKDERFRKLCDIYGVAVEE